MKIKCLRSVGQAFLASQSDDKRDYRSLRGKLSEGSVVEVDDELAEVLIRRGIASRDIKAPAPAPDIARAGTVEKATEDMKSYKDKQTEAAAKK